MHMSIYEAWADVASAGIDLIQAVFENSFILQLHRGDDALFDPDCV